MASAVRTYTGDQAYLQAADGLNALFEQGYLTQAETATLIKSLNSKLEKHGVDVKTI
jgi:hypothetical protein